MDLLPLDSKVWRWIWVYTIHPITKQSLIGDYSSPTLFANTKLCKIVLFSFNHHSHLVYSSNITLIMGFKVYSHKHAIHLKKLMFYQWWVGKFLVVVEGNGWVVSERAWWRKAFVQASISLFLSNRCSLVVTKCSLSYKLSLFNSYLFDFDHVHVFLASGGTSCKRWQHFLFL